MSSWPSAERQWNVPAPTRAMAGVVPFLKCRVARAERADHVFDRPVVALREQLRPEPRRGAAALAFAAVVERFFQVAGTEWDGWSMTVEQLLDAGDAVVAEGRYAGTYKPTGNCMDVQVCHVWRLRDGKIASFHQYVDTAGLRRVMGGGCQASCRLDSLRGVPIWIVAPR